MEIINCECCHTQAEVKLKSIQYKKQDVGCSYHCGSCHHLFNYAFTISWFRFRKRLYSIIDGEQTFYKGDIVQHNTDNRGNTIDMLWGTDLIGVIQPINIRNCTLFYRPFRNSVKHLFNILIKRYFYVK